MAEPNGDPPPPQAPPAGPPAPQVPPATLPQALATAPRTDPPTVANPRNPSVPPPALANPNDLLALLQAVAATKTPARKTLSKNEKKFHRHEPEPPGPEVDGSSASEETTPGLRTPIHVDLPPPPSEVPVVRKRRLKPGPPTGTHWGKRAWRLLIPTALAAGIFLAGRVTAPNRPPVVVSAVPHAVVDHIETDPEVPKLISQAMAAENKMDFAKATGFFEEVLRRKSRIAGVDYHMALLAYESGDTARALPLLNRSIEKGEEVAACYNLRGTLTNRLNGHGLEDLETATRVDPYNARYFYFVGEALRRAGKPAEALPWLCQSSDRVRDAATQSLYDLKVRLTQIELGQAGDFTAQLATELKHTPPTTDWLFTAAAVALHERRFPEASKYFDQILTLTDQATMNNRLADYFFINYAHEKAVAWFFAPLGMVNMPTPTPAPNPASPAPPSLP